MIVDLAWNRLVTLTLESALLCLIAGLGMALLRKAAAATRHLLLSLSVIALLAIPFLSLCVPRQHVVWFWEREEFGGAAVRPAAPVAEPRTGISSDPAPTPSSPVFSASTRMLRTPTARLSTLRASTAQRTALQMPPAQRTALRTPTARLSASRALLEGAESPSMRTPIPLAAEPREPHLRAGWTETTERALLSVWLFGLCVCLARLLIGLIATRRVTARQTVAAPMAARMAREVKGELGIRCRVEVRQVAAGSRLPAPLVWGFLRPTLLLPATFSEWPRERQRMVLLHELAHVQRADWLVQTLVEITRALYWFHPLVWWTTRRLQAESERACDDTVLLTGVTPSAYAETLLEVIRTMHRSKMSFISLLGMARPPIETRLRAILSPQRRQRPGRPVVFLAGVGTTIGALALASLQVGARPALAAPQAAVLPGQAETVDAEANAARQKATEARRRSERAQADRERQNARAQRNRGTEGDAATLRQRLDALEQLLVRNQQENAQLRQQLKALQAQQGRRAAQGGASDLQARERAEVALVTARHAQQEALRAMVRDLEAQQETMKVRTKQAEELYRSGAATLPEATRLRAEQDAVRLRLQAVLEQLRASEVGRKISAQEQKASQLRLELAVMQARLQQEQTNLSIVKERYRAGLVPNSEFAVAEASVDRIRVEIDKLQLKLSQEGGR
jgi:beta-lactamase regulating signal transducer with metallopeptidase domain